MTNLHGLYFDEYALNFLAQFILILGMLFYFLRTKRHAQQLWSVFFAFIGLAIFTGGRVNHSNGRLESSILRPVSSLYGAIPRYVGWAIHQLHIRRHG